jgi:acetylornithine deacetylase
MSHDDILALHRALVGIPSVSGGEGGIASFLADWLGARGVAVERVGANLLAVLGRGPLVCLDSHLDTVPPSGAWSRDPYRVTVEDGRVYGLGSNDAKASVAAMVAAFLHLTGYGEDLGLTVALMLAEEEETTNRGSAALVEALRARGFAPEAVIVGEPTGLDVAVAQKGLLVLELVARGETHHAAHARALGAVNPVAILARDLVTLEGLDLGGDDPDLGPVTVVPTVVRAGEVRNMVPAEASCILDVRTNPTPEPSRIVERLREALRSEVRVRSGRLRPIAVDRGHPLVAAALRARPDARLFGSRGLSDLVCFPGVPGIKAGPGRSERSHTPDEFVLEEEILEGARFYESMVLECRSFLTEGVCS